jgi:hypothetical protein
MYNSSVVSSYTPESFEIHPNMKDLYEINTANGFKNAKTKKVVIAALVRDVGSRISEIIKKAEKVGSLFANYHVLIVENDSSDDTREKLLDWARKNSNVTILGCGYNVEKCSIPKNNIKTIGHHVDRPRIQKMVDLRNIYLEEIKKNFYNYDYAVFWDLDMIGSVYVDGIANSIDFLHRNPDADVTCAYGIYHWGLFTLFYDTYALLHKGEKFHIDMKTIHDIRKGLWEVKYQRGDDPVEVDSCFSGFAIYKVRSILPENVIYDMSQDGNLECEHVRLNIKIKGKKYVNPSMINLVLENS